MATPEVQGFDLFKIANRSISGCIPSLKTGTVMATLTRSLPRSTGCRSRNMRRSRLDTPLRTNPIHYLPDVVGSLTDGKPFIAEAGMEDDKPGDRNLAKAEAARRLARFQQGIFWIGTNGAGM